MRIVPCVNLYLICSIVWTIDFKWMQRACIKRICFKKNFSINKIKFYLWIRHVTWKPTRACASFEDVSWRPTWTWKICRRSLNSYYSFINHISFSLFWFWRYTISLWFSQELLFCFAYHLFLFSFGQNLLNKYRGYPMSFALSLRNVEFWV